MRHFAPEGGDDRNKNKSNNKLLKSRGYSIATLVPLDNISNFLFLNKVVSQSEIIRVEDAFSLNHELPARSLGFPWKMVYSTSRDGACLSTLYRKVALSGAADLPCLVFIMDVEGGFFGCYNSCGWRMNAGGELFYGDYNTFVFRGSPEFEVYRWDGSRDAFFLRGQKDFVSVGSSDGKHALWLDDCLNKGRTEACGTFSSPPLASKKDFQVKILECWSMDDIVH